MVYLSHSGPQIAWESLSRTPYTREDTGVGLADLVCQMRRGFGRSHLGWWQAKANDTKMG